MGHLISRATWIRSASAAAIGAGLVTAMMACSSSSDDSTSGTQDSGASALEAACVTPDAATVTDSAAATDSAAITDSASKSDSSATDSGAKDSGTPAVDSGPVADSAVADTSTPTVDSSTPPPVDAGPKDIALDLCGTLDQIWQRDPSTARAGQYEWPTEIADGPPQFLPDGAVSNDPQYGFSGYINLIGGDCNVNWIFNVVPPQNVPAWTDIVVAFEYQFFGCPTDASIPAFALVPADVYGQPLTTADLKRLGDYFVEAILQQVANQSGYNQNIGYGDVITADQIADIEQKIAFEITTYPDIISSNGYSNSSCPAPVDAGGD